MTDTSEILGAFPGDVPPGVAEIAAAIDACLNCVQSCTSCADADLAEDEVAEMRTCIALCLNCADVCELTARVLSRLAHWDHFFGVPQGDDHQVAPVDDQCSYIGMLAHGP